jgi:acyl-CoA thioesterase FadM
MADFRVKFETTDGNLIMNQGNVSIFFQKACSWYGRTCCERESKEVDGFLAQRAREKGVRIVSTDVTKTGVNCIVTWL